jgi:hypothetical protein
MAILGLFIGIIVVIVSAWIGDQVRSDNERKRAQAQLDVLVVGRCGAVERHASRAHEPLVEDLR